MFALYLIAGFVVVGAATLILLSHHPFFKMTSTTPGRVVRAEERVVRDERERREETVIVCRYTVAGREYEVERVFAGRGAGRFPEGKAVTVRYNPSDPPMARIASE